MQSISKIGEPHLKHERARRNPSFAPLVFWLTRDFSPFFGTLDFADRSEDCDIVCRCDRPARLTGVVLSCIPLCKEGGQGRCCHIYSSVSQLSGGIAQLVERLVRNESGRNSPTQSQPLISILPVVKAQLRVYLTLSETFS